MATTKDNGDPLDGEYVIAGSYPNPAANNVNMYEWGVGSIIPQYPISEGVSTPGQAAQKPVKKFELIYNFGGANPEYMIQWTPETDQEIDSYFLYKNGTLALDVAYGGTSLTVSRFGNTGLVPGSTVVWTIIVAGEFGQSVPTELTVDVEPA